MAPRSRGLTAPALRSYKVGDGAAPLVMVTAYDAPSARIAEAAGVDLILVGDSVAMVVLGYEDTLRVTVPDMVHHVGAVARGLDSAQRARAEDPGQRAARAQGSANGVTAPMVIGDLPWLSYHLSAEDTIRNAAALVMAGAGAVKLEGGRKRVNMIEALAGAEIPVIGHIGLTPQSVKATGGYKVQGRQAQEAKALLDDAKALVDAGCVAIVLECVPDVVARLVTRSIAVPTIGIGAGPGCDGQVLVFHDLLGFGARATPKFVRRYGRLEEDAITAMSAYAEDVRTGRFPSDDESYHLSDEVAQLLGLYG